MKLNKYDFKWSMFILIPAMLALVIALIPGSAVLYSMEEETLGQVVYSSLVSTDGWEPLDYSPSLQMILVVYAAVMSLVYLRGQSINVLKTIMIVGFASGLLGLGIIVGSENLRPLPYIVFPLLGFVVGTLSLIRTRKEEDKFYS